MTKKRRPRASKVITSFQRVQRSQRIKTSKDKWPVKEIERSLESMWMDKIPEGLSPLEWLQAWADGYPDEHAVDLYNSMHPEEMHIVLDDGEGDEE